jgi:hypothetical protein
LNRKGLHHVQHSRFSPAALVGLTAFALVVANAEPASARDWPETVESCARLVGLVTVAEVEKITGRKGVVFAAVEADAVDSCRLTITIPRAKTPGPNISGMALQLKQFVSGKEAGERVAMGLRLSGSANKATEIARDARGAAYQFKYVFEYASAHVDATEISVLVRDSTLDGRKVTKAIGELMFRRALSSDAIAAHSASMLEVAGYIALTPLLALTTRCMKDDMPQHVTTRQVVEASVIKALAIKPVASMSPYAQRWIATNRYEEMLASRLKPLEQGTVATIAPECEKMTAELPAFLSILPAPLLRMHSKP